MTAPLTLTISDYLQHACPNLRLGAVIGSLRTHGSGSADIGAALDALSADEALLEDPWIAGMDDTFRRVGANPKRYAPSATALLRRLIAGKGMYRVNDLVDTNNLLSCQLRIPCGIYDREAIEGTRLLFDFGAPQETYFGIDEVEQRTQGKLLLSDEVKVLGGPHADAWPSRITADTRHFLCVLYYPDLPETPPEVKRGLDVAGKLFERLCDATVLGVVGT